MVTIRMFTGIIIKYPNAKCMEHKPDGVRLYDGDPAKGGQFIAFVQATCGCVIDLGEVQDMIYPPMMRTGSFK